MTYSIHKFNFHILLITALLPFWLFLFVQFDDLAQYLQLDMNNEQHALYVKGVMNILKFAVQSIFIVVSTAILFWLPVRAERRQLFDHQLVNYIFTPIVFFFTQSSFEAFGWAILIVSLYIRGCIIHHFLEYYQNQQTIKSQP